MTGTELGAATVGKPEVDIFVYNHGSFDELLDTFTHEVVHLVHPEWEKKEGPVTAVTAYLLRHPEWQIVAAWKVGGELLKGVTNMRKQKAHELR